MNALSLPPRARDLAASIISNASRLNPILGNWSTAHSIEQALIAAGEIEVAAEELERALADEIEELLANQKLEMQP